MKLIIWQEDPLLALHEASNAGVQCCYVQGVVSFITHVRQGFNNNKSTINPASSKMAAKSQIHSVFSVGASFLKLKTTRQSTHTQTHTALLSDIVIVITLEGSKF